LKEHFVNRKITALALAAVTAVGLALTGCGNAAPQTQTDEAPVTQPSAQPYVATSACPNTGAWCPVPKVVTIGHFQITLGKTEPWIAEYITASSVVVAQPGHYDKVSVLERSALVARGPSATPAQILHGIVIGYGTDLKPEPAPAAALDFKTAAYSFTGTDQRRCYAILLVHGDNALYIVGDTAYPNQEDADVYKLSAQHVALSVKRV
jgi:hypothetical protein